MNKSEVGDLTLICNSQDNKGHVKIKKNEIRNIRQDKNIKTRYYKTEDFLQSWAIITKWYYVVIVQKEGVIYRMFYSFISGV